MEYLLGIQDLIVTPIFFAILYLFVSAYGKRKYEGTVYYRYFINAFLLRAIGSIAIGLVYFYYFKNGDTLYYFRNGVLLKEAFLDNPSSNWIVFFSEFFHDEIIQISYVPVNYLAKANAYMMLRVNALLSIISFDSYFATGLFYSFFSFVGIWKLFTVFAGLYPGAHKRLALSILYFPSVVMWGSGIFKDTLTIGGLGLVVYLIYRLLIKRQFRAKYIILLLISFYLVGIVKSYVLIALVPSIIFYVLNQYAANIKSTAVKTVFFPIVMGLVVLISVFALNSLSNIFTQYNVENLETKMEGFQRWHTKRSEQAEGSGYSLGIEAGAGLAGAIVKFPLAVNVTLFRPYLWEARKPFVFIAALESLFVLWLTLRTLAMVGFRGLFSSLLGDPLISFCFVFSVIFAFGIGVTSYNFGALVRFKIQCMPFYLSAIYLTRYNHIVKNNLSFKML